MLGQTVPSMRVSVVLCIQLFLEVLPEAQSQWLNKTMTWRRQYEEIKNQASHAILLFFVYFERVESLV